MRGFEHALEADRLKPLQIAHVDMLDPLTLSRPYLQNKTVESIIKSRVSYSRTAAPTLFWTPDDSEKQL
jgi:hypothetical protein